MRDYAKEYEKRVAFIRDLVEQSHARGIVFGNSGGKDSALVGILCKAACENTLGVLMPCASKRNYGEDAEDGRALAETFGIESRLVDLTPVREAELAALEGVSEMNSAAISNIAPRLRMTTSMRSPRPRAAWWPAPATAASATWAISPNGATAPATSTPSPI